MSIHPSLRGVNTLEGERSVLSRFERIQKLVHDGKLDADKGSAYGLLKVCTHFKVASAKKKKAAEESTEETPAAEGEAPAAE